MNPFPQKNKIYTKKTSCCMLNLELNLSRWSHNLPDSDDIISVTSKQVLTIGRPSQRDSFWVFSSSTNSKFWFQFIQQRSFL